VDVRKAALTWLVPPVAVALLTALTLRAGANALTAGFLDLVLVLGLATWGGWKAGVVASLTATGCYNYCFLPPFGTLIIADPANWVALFSFLTATTVASRLVVNARRQAEAADLRRREVEILYELCFSLFAASQRPGGLGESAARTLGALGARSGLLFLDAPAPVSVIGDMGEGAPVLDEAALAQARTLRTLVETRTSHEKTVYIPLLVGGAFSGVLVAQGAAASRKVLESAGRLLALALERERLLAEAAHLEAVQESDALKTSLLRAVSHDLRTPLTAMQLGLEGLGREVAGRPAAEAALREVAREQERLTRRIDNLLSLARLEAGVARPHPEDVAPGALFRAARESLALVLAGRPLVVRVDRDCPDLWADPALALEIVVNLLENAARATPENGPDVSLELTAEADPDGGTKDRVRLEVRDRGPGVPAAVKRLLLGPAGAPRGGAGSAGDSRSGGLGLRIAASLAAANGGTLVLLDRPGGGSIARLILPAVAGLGDPA
jgi:two-component system sensor histidine kinase KdpD